MLPPTLQRVEMHTKPEINERIHKQMDRNVDFYRHHREQISARLEEVDKEWDIERVLQTQFGSLTLLGTLMSLVTRKRGWLILPAIAGGFMIQHALQGWCPPVPIFRRFGVRTAHEIEEERQALESTEE